MRLFSQVPVCAIVIAATATAQSSPVPPLHFLYRIPQNNNALFGCGGIVGVDVALQNCTTIAPTANVFEWTLEAQPTPAVKVFGAEIPIVPEVGIQYVVPRFAYMHFQDAHNDSFSASNQASLRFAIGYDSHFYARHLWGDRAMLKIGGACLLTRPLDLNPRREGCDNLDLDNWFVKGLFAKTIYTHRGDKEQQIGYFQASIYHEVPDHDFASKEDSSGYVADLFNDDGLDVTFADISFLAKGPTVRFPGSGWRTDLRLGVATGLAHQIETATYVQGNLLATMNIRSNLAVTTGVKYTQRSGSFSGSTEDQSYWMGQLYFEWRPDIVIFYDHRY
jgi:hypothetical protein